MRKQTKLWTTTDGSRVRICDMVDSHLVDCTNAIKRYAQIQQDQAIMSLLPNLPDLTTSELESRLDRIGNHHWENFVLSIFWSMIDDIKRRIALRPGIVKNLIGIPNWILEE